MTRPLYESAENLANEDLFKSFLEIKWHCTLHKLPISYKLDFMGVRKNGTNSKLFIEYKRRGVNKTKYKTIFISLNKVLTALDYKNKLGIDTFFFINYDDALCYVSLTGDYDFIEMGGRTNRNDSQDLEPMVHFNIKRLNTIIAT